MFKLFNKQPKNKQEPETKGKPKAAEDKADSTDRKKSAQSGGFEKRDDKKKDDEKDKERKPVVATKTVTSSRGYGIFIRPRVSEKAAHASADDIYSFVVTNKANKVEIKKAFLEMYKIKPVSVRIVNMPFLAKMFGKNWGVRGAWKKAYIKVPKGSKVDLYEGV